MGIFSKIFGNESSKFIGSTKEIVAKINALEVDISKLADADFPKKMQEFKDRLAKAENKAETFDEILPEAFALVREAGKRILGERHYDVQLVGGLALHSGKITEMKTGEGKTLVATLPAYLNALGGNGVHIVTVNDYLSRRDAVWMGQIYDYLGLSVGVINHEASYLYDVGHRDKDPKSEIRNLKQIQNSNEKNSKDVSDLDRERDALGSFKVVHEFLRPVTRREAYAADITYGTNNELGFDYLRDNLEYDPRVLRQREHMFAIVDEV